MRVSLLLKVELFLQFSTYVLASRNDTITDAEKVVGAYPISGQYGLLNRVLFYALWIVVFCTGKMTWPAIGALAYVMAYSATAAVHAMILAITSTNSLYDLDAAGAWAILSFASILAPTIMWYSDQLRNSVYRPVFGFWSTTVATGAICCITALLRDYPKEPACWSNAANESGPNTTTFLTRPTQLLAPNRFNCSYAFFNTSQPTRNPADITVITTKRAFGILYQLLIVGIVLTVVLGLFWAILGFCLVGERKRTKEELEEIIKRKVPRAATAKQRRSAQENRARALREFETGTYQNTSNYFLRLDPIALPVVMAFNEAYILALQPLPCNEAVYAIGQWGSWVTVGLSLIAAAINAKYEPRWAQIKKILDDEHEEFVRQRQRASIPQIKLYLENSAQNENSPSWQELVLKEALPKLPPPADEQESKIFPRPGKDFIQNDRRPNVIHERDISSFAGWIPLQTRRRLDRIKYDPPFLINSAVSDPDSMTIVQYDGHCEAYDEVGTKHDGLVVRDLGGRDWIVQRGLLWHRELWEKGKSCEGV
jgi:predicted permease